MVVVVAIVVVVVVAVAVLNCKDRNLNDYLIHFFHLPIEFFFSALNFDFDSFKNCSIFAKLFLLENLNCNIIINYFRLFLTLLP